MATGYFQQSSSPFVNFYPAHHHHISNNQFAHQQNGRLRLIGDAPSTSSQPFQFVESSVCEMVLEQLELLRGETEKIVVRPVQSSSAAFGLEPPPGVEKIVSTYRAVLARRNILVKEKIGSGSYSKVRLAFRLSNNSALVDQLAAVSSPTSPPQQSQHSLDDLKLEMVAVKIVDRRRAPKDYQTRFMPRELDIWATLRHPNVVRLHETFSDPLERFVFMVSEYLEGGDCLRYVQRIGSLNEQTACHWVAQLCCGVRYMHAKGVCHRDLKLENLFLERDASRIKIGDLGFARRFGNSAKELSQTYCGSKSYAAPEILKGIPHDAKKSDVWAIGVIGYILLTGKMPFDESQSNRRIIEDQRRLTVLHWDRFPQLSPTSRAFVDHALTFAYTKRPAVSALLRHDWLMPHREMIAELEQTYLTNNRGKQSHQSQLQQQSGVTVPLFNKGGSSKNGSYPTGENSNNGVSSRQSPMVYHHHLISNNHRHYQPNSSVKMACDTSDPMVVCSPPFEQSKQQNQQNQQNQSMMPTSSSSSSGTGSGTSNSGGGGSGAPFSSCYVPLRPALMMTTSSGGTTSASTSSSVAASSMMTTSNNSNDFELGGGNSGRFFGIYNHSASMNISNNNNNSNIKQFGEQIQQQFANNHHPTRHHHGRYHQFGFQPGNQ